MKNFFARPLDSPTAFKRRECLNTFSDLNGFSLISLVSVISWKIGKGRVKRSARPKSSKVCAGNTCTPCEGFDTPSTPHASGKTHARGGHHD